MRSVTIFTLACFVPLLIASIAPADEHRLGRGDRIRINVLDEPEVSKEAVLDADGQVSLALINTIRLSGMTCAEAAESVRTALKQYIVQPEVSVELIGAAKTRVFIVGEVKKQGMMMLDPGARLIEALGTAEYLESADLSKITIQRKSQIIAADLTLFLSGKDVTPNVLVAQDDNIIVPRRGVAGTVLVLGAVGKPGPTEIRPGMTVREAIASAGGITPDADSARITIKHEGDQQALPVDYNRAVSGDPTADIAVAPGDTILVPTVDVFFTIQGGVRTPGRYPLGGRMTIEEATAIAGGLTKDARIDRIEIVHSTGGTLRSEKVDLGKMRRGSSPVVIVKAGDSIVIPTKKSKPDFLQVLGVLGSLGWILVR